MRVDEEHRTSEDVSGTLSRFTVPVSRRLLVHQKRHSISRVEARFEITEIRGKAGVFDYQPLLAPCDFLVHRLKIKGRLTIFASEDRCADVSSSTKSAVRRSERVNRLEPKCPSRHRVGNYPGKFLVEQGSKASRFYIFSLIV
ncbi:hypothetical protein KM043_014829 [Ampulex compressa]|nr:hypothetical protein KM043_014829 [Ampulex compressa]